MKIYDVANDDEPIEVEIIEAACLPNEENEAGNLQRRAAGIQRRLDISGILFRHRNDPA